MTDTTWYLLMIARQSAIFRQPKCDFRPKWNSMKRRYWDQKIWIADMSKVKKKFNWKPKYNLSKGLTKTISWHKNFYN